MTGPINLFPMFLKLAGRRCLVVGGGAVAEGKIASLLDTGAKVIVVAPDVTEKVSWWASTGEVEWRARCFCPPELDDVFLVVAATSHPEVNDLVFREAQSRGILCNVVDDPERCDFYYPAVLHRGQLQIAISTGGSSPALAQRLRRELEQQFAPGYGEWLEELGEARRHLLRTPLDESHRRRWLHRMASRESFANFLQRRAASGRRSS
jgi:precorrin-2 dehydrogenase/sirohydrochlorin ferrochelatase